MRRHSNGSSSDPSKPSRKAVLLCTLLCTFAAAPAVAEQSSPEDSPADDTDEIIVSARAFRDKSSASSAKLEIPLVDTPQSISLVSREVLLATGAVQVLDAVQYVPGVDFGGSAGLQPSVFSRGFEVSRLFGYMLDGVSLGAEITLDPVVVDRVEFVKGANSITYGQNSPGGFINVISRAPGSDLAGGIAVRAGSFGNVRVEGD